MAKSPDAFRTISEVADWLGIQAHVLRFWESKFSQVKPIKRAGGRRYYRPTDMLLLGGIKKLLHDDGLTIKGVQKILREQGMAHVSDLSAPLDDDTLAHLDDMPATPPQPEPAPPVAEEKGVVLSFDAPAEDTPDVAEPVDTAMVETPAAAAEEMPQAVDPEPAPIAAADEAEPTDEPEVQADAAMEIADDTFEDAQADTSDEAEGSIPEMAMETATEEPATPDAPAEPTPEADTDAGFAAQDEVTEEPAPEEDAPAPKATLPAFLQRPLDVATEPASDEPAPEPAFSEPEEMEPAQDAPVAAAPETIEPEPALRPRDVDVPAVPSEAEIAASPGTLSATYARKSLSADEARKAAPLLERLAVLRDAMASQRRNNGVSSSGG